MASASGPARDTGGFRQTWNSLSDNMRVFVILGVVAVVVVIGLLLAATEPWKSEREKQCERMAHSNMLTGEEFDEFVDICKGL
ncbi:hypothetical protein A5662_25830 [Mycobacteriaceae bacterium 1482268.1]|nr:hypothetical protein A5662_25830 [Mycobacteriaceae bacterium 1482268.1]